MLSRVISVVIYKLCGGYAFETEALRKTPLYRNKKIKKICLPLRPYKVAAASSVKHPCWRQLGLVHIFPHLCVWVSSTIHSPWKVLLCSEPRVSPAKRGMINVCCLQAKYGKQLLFSDLLFVCSFSHGESL